MALFTRAALTYLYIFLALHGAGLLHISHPSRLPKARFARASAKMGGGPDKEHLLIVLWEPEPKHITAEIKRRFPYFDITYIQLDLSSNPWGGAMTKGVSTGKSYPQCHSVTRVSEPSKSRGTKEDCLVDGACR